MKNHQDAIWRDAASSLDLTGFDHRGDAVDRAYVTRNDTLRGRVDGHHVTMSYGLDGHADGVTVITVRTRQPLLLGLEIRSSAAGSDGRGRRTYPERTTIDGIDSGHVATVLATAPGIEALQLVERFGKLGWALFDDSALRAHLEAHADAQDGWARVVRSVVRAVALVEQACEKTGPSPWAVRLLGGLKTAAAPLDLEVDASTLTITGRHRDVPITLGAKHTRKRGYELVCTVELPKPVKKSARVERREGFFDRALASLGIGTTGRDRVLERAFRIAGPTEWISPEVSAALVSAPERIHVSVESRTLTLRDSVLEGDAGEMLRVAVGVIGGLRGAAGAPYR